MTLPIRTALERLVAAVKPKYTDPEEIVEAASAVLAARAALKSEPEGEGPSERIVSIAKAVQECAFTHEPDARLIGNVCAEDVADLCAAVLSRWGDSTPPAPETPAEALAARPLLEQVAAMSACIGAQTVGQVTAISNRAGAWLRENPPGRAEPVAVSEQPWKREGWCDHGGRCWFGSVGSRRNDPGWVYRKPCEVLHQTISLPHNAIPLPAPQAGEGEA